MLLHKFTVFHPVLGQLPFLPLQCLALLLGLPEQLLHPPFRVQTLALFFFQSFLEQQNLLILRLCLYLFRWRVFSRLALSALLLKLFDLLQGFPEAGLGVGLVLAELVHDLSVDGRDHLLLGLRTHLPVL